MSATPGADDAATRRATILASATTSRRIFISYARVDAPVAHQVEQVLTQWGCQPWLDQRSLSGGQDWSAALEQAIDGSQALALILTPAALASQMVCWEYERALARGLPVLLIRAGRVEQLPPTLAHAPLIDFQNTQRAGSSLYFTLADCGLAPAAPEDRLDAVVGFSNFAVVEGRTPPDWTVYQVPVSYYRRRLLLAAAPLLAALALPFLAEPALPRDSLGGGTVGVLVTALTLISVSLWLFGGRWGLVVLMMARERIQPEMVIREPAACSSFVARAERGVQVMPHRYLYAWAASARVSSGHWGAARVDFIDRASGQVVSMRIPQALQNRRAIAEAIVADVAACHARQGAPERAATPAAPGNARATPQPAQARYCIIAPRAAGAAIASAQAWLSRRGIAPAEMVWDAEGGGLLLPTSRGAAESRFALFTDEPAITQSSRCRNILADLRRRGTLLIPLRVTSAPPAPSEWSVTQWVDFSPAAARARSLLGLCDALDRAGISLSLRPDDFDPEVALVRGVFERTPPDWSAFVADAAMERALQRSHRRAGIVMALSVVGILALIGISTIQAAQMESPASPGYQYFTTGAVAGMVILALLSLPFWRLVARHLRQARVHDDILRDRGAPECLVVTPHGIAYHLIGKSRRRPGAAAPFDAPHGFLAGGLAFGALSAVTRRRTLVGSPLLRLETRSGQVVTLPLANLLSTSTAAAEAAIAAFTAARARRTASG